MSEWLTQYQWLRSCSGIEIQFLPEQSCSFRLVEVSVNNNQLSIDTKRDSAGNLAAILEKTAVKSPVALTLTGKGILTKKTSLIVSLTNETLQGLFPNLDASQFYIQHFASGTHSYLSLIRKDTADEVLNTFQKAGITVLSLSLGPFPVAQVLSQFNSYDGNFSFDGHSISYLLPNHSWEDYRYEPGITSLYAIKTGNEPIPEQYIIAYSTAFQLALYKRVSAVNLQTPAITARLFEFEQKQTFRFRFAVVTGVFFVLLLLNFFLFAWYTSKNNELQQRASISSANDQSISNTRIELKANEKLLEQLGWKNALPYAYICDQLGSTVPAQISLEELSLNASAGIHMQGHVPDIATLNTWIYRLKQKDWIKQVNIDRYIPSDRDNMQQFSLTISY